MRNFLGSILAILALNAFAGGFYGLDGAYGVPTEWLDGSPFRNYFVPSLILFIVVGGSSLMAAIAVFRRTRYARRISFLSGAVVLCWITVQLLIIGYVSWLQPAILLTGICIIILAWRLPASSV